MSLQRTALITIFAKNRIEAIRQTGNSPVATGMTPDSTKAYVASLLKSTITTMDTATQLPMGTINLLATSTVVKMFDCDSGCHGVQYGAKQSGGYYAYVSSKFQTVSLSLTQIVTITAIWAMRPLPAVFCSLRPALALLTIPSRAIAA
ncbi:MAG: hypothetical protein JSR31_15955 [Nitrospira sp.]|nr:hypothetical protein [Nitrospira sp.]